MNLPSSSLRVCLPGAYALGAALLLLSGSAGFASDSVTVPKSRLEELERKEKELDRLKGDLNKSRDENAKLKKESEKAAMRPVQSPPPEPAPVYVSPPLESLPALRPDQAVESMDLANYYRADTAAADRRFLKQKLSVHGEIVGFEKPLWKRSYRIFLKTPDRDAKVMCDLPPPEKANAVFTINHGDDLVALMNDTRVPIAKVGQQVVIKGECKGFSDSVITILAWELKPAP